MNSHEDYGQRHATAETPLPPPVRNTSNPASSAEYQPLERITIGTVADALLKRPARLTCEMTRKNSSAVQMRLLVLTAACLVVYGLAMASFTGGAQFWVVPLKLALGTFLSALLCLPSLYIFASLAGGRLALREIGGLLLMALCLAGLLLVGFAPVAWLFAQSTGTVAWMGFLHLLFWIAALSFGLRLLRTAFEFVNGQPVRVLRLWAVVFLAVLLQMSTCLRPLVGRYAPLNLGEKKFFVTHWGECLK